MKKLVSIALLCTTVLTVVAQTPKIIVQGAGAPAMFTSFSAAVAAAGSNDIIYLSGGDFSLNNLTVYIDHEVHIVGAGFHPDSAAQTLPTRIVNGSIRFHLPASNCTVTGVELPDMRYGDVNGNNVGCVNMLFSRCRLDGPIYAADNAGSSTTFDQCYLTNDFSAFNIGNSVTVRNSICNGDYAQNGAIVYEHCFIFGNEIGANGTNTYQDCVLARADVASTGSGTYVRCLLYNWTISNQSTDIGCITSPTNPFANYPILTFGGPDYAADLHLAAGNPGVGAATDGTDIGPFGGNTPLKPGFVPYNPHYLDINIAGSTDAGGNLPVNITVKRQTY